MLGAAWFFGSPLFLDDTVDEALPVSSGLPMQDDGHLDMTAVMKMPASERNAMRDSIMSAAAGAPPREAAEPMPGSAPEKIRQGQFSDADAIHKGSGTAAVYTLPDGGHLVRFEDFRTTNGPALVVYLAKHPSPASADDVLDGGFVELGKLKGNVGNQNYNVPAGVDVSEYGSVVIWCELFDVLFSPAPLADT